MNVISDINFIEDPFKSSEIIWERSNKNAAANGSVMRTSPLGIFEYKDIEKVIENTKNIGKVTHVDERCINSCLFVTLTISLILQNTNLEKEVNIEEIFEQVLKYIKFENNEHEKEFKTYLNMNNLKELELDESSKIGYCFKALGSGIVGLRMTNEYSFDKIIQLLTLEGGDSDTNGCVCGSLIGCYLGYQNLPQKWIERLPHKEYLDEKVNEFLKIII